MLVSSSFYSCVLVALAPAAVGPVAAPPSGPVPGLIPHNDPQRVIPTVTPVGTGGSLEVVDLWGSKCKVIGLCADLGVKCPPQDPNGGQGQQDPTNPPPPVMAVWCISPFSRGECELGSLSVCELTSGPAACGAQATGRCRYDWLGNFDSIDPASVMLTGAMCPATRCK